MWVGTCEITRDYPQEKVTIIVVSPRPGIVNRYIIDNQLIMQPLIDYQKYRK